MEPKAATSICTILLVAIAAASATGQVTTVPVDTQPAVTPAAPTGPAAKVIEVQGTVKYAPVGTDPLDEAAWKPVEADMELGSGILIQTFLRSQCTLLFGEPPNETVISIRRASLASVSDYYRTENEQRVRIGLGYGAVRGGSSEGTLQSDVVIDSTVATLAKRGTEGFEIEVEPMTGYFRISLAESGLVEAYSKLLNQRKEVRPGEYVTRANIARMWINQAIFNRAVKFYELEAVTSADLDFMSRETTGFGSIAPNGNEVFDMAGRRPDRLGEDFFPGGNEGYNRLQTLLIQRLPVRRPEGDFGFGRVFRVAAPSERSAAGLGRSVGVRGR